MASASAIRAPVENRLTTSRDIEPPLAEACVGCGKSPSAGFFRIRTGPVRRREASGGFRWGGTSGPSGSLRAGSLDAKSFAGQGEGAMCNAVRPAVNEWPGRDFVDAQAE